MQNASLHFSINRHKMSFNLTYFSFWQNINRSSFSFESCQIMMYVLMNRHATIVKLPKRWLQRVCLRIPARRCIVSGSITFNFIKIFKLSAKFFNLDFSNFSLKHIITGATAMLWRIIPKLLFRILMTKFVKTY